MRLAIAALLLSAAVAPVASARSLEQIQASGTLSVCLPANSLPFSSRFDTPAGFQVELAGLLAQQLGVSLQTDGVISPIQVLRASCDLLLDVIADPEAQGRSNLALSKPYYRSGVALVVPQGSPITSFAALDGRTKVAVQVGSIVSMILGQRRVGLSTYAFEDEMLQAVADGEADAAAVTPVSAGYFNLAHPDHKLTILPPDEADQRLVWNIAIGMRKPDQALREAMDKTIDQLSANGTMARIYGRYGVMLSPPKP
ncbi:MAG: substrate-binding periplasmic protein [Xanthobacteraceae bacterium]